MRQKRVLLAHGAIGATKCPGCFPWHRCTGAPHPAHEPPRPQPASGGRGVLRSLSWPPAGRRRPCQRGRMRSSGTHARRHLAVAGVLCVLLLGGCSKSASSGTSTATTAAGTGAATAACTLLTKAEVAQATGQSIAFSKQASLRSVSTCTFGSLSG